ncbi:MAG: hypothetical protein V1707_03075, partial [bacterium]
FQLSTYVKGFGCEENVFAHGMIRQPLGDLYVDDVALVRWDSNKKLAAQYSNLAYIESPCMVNVEQNDSYYKLAKNERRCSELLKDSPDTSYILMVKMTDDEYDLPGFGGRCDDYKGSNNDYRFFFVRPADGQLVDKVDDVRNFVYSHSELLNSAVSRDIVAGEFSKAQFCQASLKRP